MARRLGVSKSMITQWESGERRPSATNLERFVAELGLTMEQFYGEIPEPEEPSDEEGDAPAVANG
jgi:transcriptional regulator with XRE-family HTH domain